MGTGTAALASIIVFLITLSTGVKRCGGRSGDCDMEVWIGLIIVTFAIAVVMLARAVLQPKSPRRDDVEG